MTDILFSNTFFMKNTTLLFLIKKDNNTVTDICLAMKKRGFGMGRWNGVGGKLNVGETVEQAVVRETQEEISVIPKQYTKIAEINFHFRDQPDWNQKCHVYFCDKWEGEPTESEEMNPKWYRVSEIPFDAMWPDDVYWLPQVLENKLIRAEFLFAPDDIVLEQKIEIVNSI